MKQQPEDVGIRLANAPRREALSADALRWRCDVDSIPYSSTADVEPLPGIIGQDVAIEALKFGLEIHAPGQNVFVRGLTGTGRMTLVRRLLEEIRLECPEVKDRCYVHNFSHPDRPRLITLGRGRGPEFRRRVHDLVGFIRDDLEGALKTEGMQLKRMKIEGESKRRIDEVVKPFEQALQADGLSLVGVQTGPVAQAALFPILEGKPQTPEEWQELVSSGKVRETEAKRIKETTEAYEPKLRGIIYKINEIHREHAEAMRALFEQTTRGILQQYVDKITADFPDPNVAVFLNEVVDDVATGQSRAEPGKDDPTRLYRVNVILNHGKGACPIIMENTPTVNNLLGTVDQSAEPGGPGRADHLLIRAGSLLRADGGYLILDARDVLREPGAWKVLLRTLKSGRLEIIPSEFIFPWWAPSLKPEAIDLTIKVVLLGDSEVYYLLDEYDPDFPHLFKVLADFDSVIAKDDEGIAKYGGVLARIVREEGLLHFDRAAVAALVEHGVRISERRDWLTTRFGRLVDIAREASFIARKAKQPKVTGEDVRSAIRRSKLRAGLPSKRFRELLADGTIRIATTGAAVGQVNGLAVIHAGPLTFGFPTRITATIGPGSEGVINIDREADLSGAIHTKGFYILSGLMRHLLWTDHPLAFNASIAFEQSYGGIDGDSASAAEIGCLLSALTAIPLRQDLAITGAIDQVGNILPVGAVNEKIEGFFDTCRELGLTGGQGVIIPATNIRNLMLREDVVAECAAGRFHVFAVDSIHEAVELLSGVSAGQRDDGGRYPVDSFLGVASARAFEFWVKGARNLETLPAILERDPSEDAPE